MSAASAALLLLLEDEGEAAEGIHGRAGKKGKQTHKERNKMNWFGLVVAGLQLCACVEGAYRGDWRRAVIYFGFAIGSAAIAWK